MKNPREKPREKYAARETAIIAAASQVFIERGVDGAKMLDIARSAKLAEGTLYLFYRNKNELLKAVVGQFWASLTEGALSAVDTEAATFDQLEQLPRYHLSALLAQIELVQLTYRAQARSREQTGELDPIRTYVRVFDGILQRGIDRGDIAGDTVIWRWRDVFFGTLEFSARTLTLRGASSDDGVVEQLVTTLKLGLGQPSDQTAIDPVSATGRKSEQTILAALERIERRLQQQSLGAKQPDEAP